MLAESVTVPATKLARATIEENDLDDATYAVLEPSSGTVRVRAATVDEELDYERAHGQSHVYRSTEEFFGALDRDFEEPPPASDEASDRRVADLPADREG